MSIAKCNGDNCNIKYECYRYIKDSDYMQSYFQAPIKYGKCDYFIKKNWYKEYTNEKQKTNDR